MLSIFRLKHFPLFVLALLVGCGADEPRPTEEIVAERAQAHQDALLKNDYEKAYTFLSPGYRETYTYKQYLGRKGTAVKREAAAVESVSCETQEGVCTVTIALTYRYTGRAGGALGSGSASQITRVDEEKWINSDGQWWLYQSD